MNFLAPMADKKPDPSIPFLSRFIATGFFSGYIPWASGTFGTMIGALFFLIPRFSEPLVLGSAIIAGVLIGVFTSAQVAEVHGNTLTKTARLAKETFQPGNHTTPDPSIVVIDEILGMWISLFAIPLTPLGIVIAFVAFRFFDIIKPYPARQLEDVPNGWGIMLDDVVAGIYANIATRVVLMSIIHLVPFFD